MSQSPLEPSPSSKYQRLPTTDFGDGSEIRDGVLLAGKGDGNDWFGHFKSHPRHFDDPSKVLAENAAYIDALFEVLPEKGLLVEFGCGPATRLLTMLSARPRSALLIDRDPRVLELAEQNASKLGISDIEFAVGDLNSPALYASLPEF